MIHWLLENSEISYRGSALSAQSREILLRHSTRSVFFQNRVIYLQEDKADKFFIVLSGYVRLSYIMEDGTAVFYGVVSPGQSFGELGVFYGSVYTDTASAIGSVSVLAVQAEVFRTDFAQNAELRNALSALIADRYKSYIDVTKGLYLSSLSARLATSLLKLAEDLGEAVDWAGKSCLHVGSMITQSDLGAMARGTRGNVNRILKNWERDGLIALQDRKIFLLDPHKLEQVALHGGEIN